jgi:hypothetical protein
MDKIYQEKNNMFSQCLELQSIQEEEDTHCKDMMETITHQAMTITAYERLMRKQSVMITEYEKSLKEIHSKLLDKEKTIKELARINYRQCSALAKFRKEKEDKDRDMRKKEREYEELVNANTILRSGKRHLGKNTTEGLHYEFQELKRFIEERFAKAMKNDAQ